MGFAAGSEGAVVSQLLSMFVGRTAASHTVAEQQQKDLLHTDVHVTAEPPVTLGYKITPINLVTGQDLAEPQVLDGTAALALHGLLMKLHAQTMVRELYRLPAA